MRREQTQARVMQDCFAGVCGCAVSEMRASGGFVKVLNLTVGALWFAKLRVL